MTILIIFYLLLFSYFLFYLSVDICLVRLVFFLIRICYGTNFWMELLVCANMPILIAYCWLPTRGQIIISFIITIANYDYYHHYHYYYYINIKHFISNFVSSILTFYCRFKYLKSSISWNIIVPQKKRKTGRVSISYFLPHTDWDLKFQIEFMIENRNKVAR